MYIFTFVRFHLRGVSSSSGHQCHIDLHGSKTRHLVRKTREQHALITEHWWSNLKYSVQYSLHRHLPLTVLVLKSCLLDLSSFFLFSHGHLRDPHQNVYFAQLVVYIFWVKRLPDMAPLPLEVLLSQHRLSECQLLKQENEGD